jgi:plastocyanin
MSKNNWIVLIIVLIIIAAGVYFLIYRNTGAPSNSATTNTPPTGAPATQGSKSTPAVQVKTVNVAIMNFSFSPATLTINKGDTVVWVNQDSVFHHILGTGFESGNLDKGQSFNFIFKTAGTFNYHCTIHPFMKGTIVVK